MSKDYSGCDNIALTKFTALLLIHSNINNKKLEGEESKQLDDQTGCKQTNGLAKLILTVNCTIMNQNV